jgi:hypothetical protein
MKIETTPTSPPDRHALLAAKTTCGGCALLIAPESCAEPERTSSFGSAIGADFTPVYVTG